MADIEWTENAEARLRRMLAWFESVGPGAGGGDNGSETPPVLGVLLGKSASNYAVGSVGTFSIYSGATQGTETDNGETIDAYVRVSAYVENTWAYLVPVGNGGWELLQPGGDLCSQLPGLTGYDDTKTQFVGHASGTCQLFDAAECDPGA